MKLCLLLFGLGLQAATLTVDPLRQYSFTSASSGVQDVRMGIDIDGKTFWSEAAHSRAWDATRGRLSLTFADFQWVITFSQRVGEWLAVGSSIFNTSSRPVKLGRTRLADGTVKISGPPGKTVALLMSGWGVWAGVKPIAGETKLTSKTLTQLHNAKGAASLNLGFLTFDHVNTEQELWWDAEKQIIRFSAYCDFEGFSLKPGARVETETMLIGTTVDPLAALESWTNHVREHYKPKVWEKIPAGWVGWSWVDPFNVEPYESVVRRNAKAIREKLPGLDLEYIWVSLGNLKDREPGAWLSWNKKLMPSGPEKLVADIKTQNFKLGLWAGAFWLSSRLKEDVVRLQDAFLLKDGKPMTVPHRDLGDQYILDPTHPKTHAFVANAFEQYRKWGIRYYMIDFLYSISGSTPGRFIPDGYFNKELIPGPETYRAGVSVVRKAAGADTYLLSSTGPTFHNLGLMDGMRVGNDYGEGRPLDGPGKGFYPATFVINSPNYWTSHKAAVNALAMSWFMNHKLFVADSGNVFTVDKPIPMPDAQIAATLFAINGGPLMLGDDIERMAPERLDMIKRQFPRLPETARPLDLFQSLDYPRVFHLKVRKPWDEWSLLAVFNFGNEELRQTVELSQLGFAPDAKVVVWDHWQERYLGVRSNQLTISVPSNGVRYLRISSELNHPWLLSTDLHVRQGQAEVENVQWNETTQELEITAKRPAGDRGSIFLRAPKGYAVKNPAGLWIAKDANDGSLIIRIDAGFRKDGVFKTNIPFLGSVRK